MQPKIFNQTRSLANLMTKGVSKHRGPSIADKARSPRANRMAADLAPVIAELQAAGVTSLNGIAEALNARGVLTPAGSDHWYASQVARLLKRLAGQARWAPNMRSN